MKNIQRFKNDTSIFAKILEWSIEKLIAYSFGICGCIANGIGFISSFAVNSDISKSNLWYLIIIFSGTSFICNIILFVVLVLKHKKYQLFTRALILINGYCLFTLELYANGYTFFTYYYILAVYCGTCVKKLSQVLAYILLIFIASIVFLISPVKNTNDVIVATDKWKLLIEPLTTYIVIFTVTSIIFAKINQYTVLLLQQEEHLKKIIQRDALTNAFTRRVLEEDLKKKNAKVVIMIDIDNFKHVNDTYGHKVGDLVLRNLASQFYSYRCYNFQLYRYGGEEFCILSCYSLSKTLSIMESIYSSVRKNLKANEELVTISSGIASVHSDAEQTLKIADGYLYKAKQNGKNKACVDGEFMFGIDQIEKKNSSSGD